jgi:hypothetical protein
MLYIYIHIYIYIYIYIWISFFQGLQGAVLPRNPVITPVAGSACTATTGQWINSSLIIPLRQNVPAASVCQFSFNIQNPAVGQVKLPLSFFVILPWACHSLQLMSPFLSFPGSEIYPTIEEVVQISDWRICLFNFITGRASREHCSRHCGEGQHSVLDPLVTCNSRQHAS